MGRLHAKPHGRVTRRSKLVRTRQRGQEKPLPMQLQVLPQKLSRTSRNPGCLPTNPVMATYAQLPDNRQFYIEGRELMPVEYGAFRVVVNGKLVGCALTSVYGLAYVRRAELCGLQAELYL